MSDTSQGYGWWLASDGKYYPPERHPEYVAPSPPGQSSQPEYKAPPPPGPSVELSDSDELESGDSTLPAGAWLTIIGGVVAVVSGFLPWFSFTSTFSGSLNRNAYQLGNNSSFSVTGAVLLLLGTVGIVIGIARLTRSRMPNFLQRSPIVLGCAVALAAVLQISSINHLAEKVNNTCNAQCTASIGFGLYTALGGAALLLVGGVVLRTNNDSSQSEGQRPDWRSWTPPTSAVAPNPPGEGEVALICGNCGSVQNVSGSDVSTKCASCGTSVATAKCGSCHLGVVVSEQRTACPNCRAKLARSLRRSVAFSQTESITPEQSKSGARSGVLNAT